MLLSEHAWGYNIRASAPVYYFLPFLVPWPTTEPIYFCVTMSLELVSYRQVLRELCHTSQPGNLRSLFIQYLSTLIVGT